MTSIQSIFLTSCVVLSLMSTGMAAADVPATKTFEGQMSSFRMPVTANGNVTVRECDECEFTSIRLTPNTRYHINREYMDFAEFQARLRELRADGQHAINVRRDEASQTVTVIFLYTE